MDPDRLHRLEGAEWRGPVHALAIHVQRNDVGHLRRHARQEAVDPVLLLFEYRHRDMQLLHIVPHLRRRLQQPVELLAILQVEGNGVKEVVARPWPEGSAAESEILEALGVVREVVDDAGGKFV